MKNLFEICRGGIVNGRGRNVHPGSAEHGLDGQLFCGATHGFGGSLVCKEESGQCCPYCDVLMLDLMSSLDLQCTLCAAKRAYMSVEHLGFAWGGCSEVKCEKCQRVFRDGFVMVTACLMCRRVVCPACVVEENYDKAKEFLCASRKAEEKRTLGAFENEHVKVAMEDVKGIGAAFVCSYCQVKKPCMSCTSLRNRLVSMIRPVCIGGHRMVVGTVASIGEKFDSVRDGFTCFGCARSFTDPASPAVYCQHCDVSACFGCMLRFNPNWKSVAESIVAGITVRVEFASRWLPATVNPRVEINGDIVKSTGSYGTAMFDASISGGGQLRGRVEFKSGSVNSIGVLPVADAPENFLYGGSECGFYNSGAGFHMPQFSLDGVLDVELDLDTRTFTVVSRGVKRTCPVPDELCGRGNLTIGVLLWGGNECQIYPVAEPFVIPDSIPEAPERESSYSSGSYSSPSDSDSETYTFDEESEEYYSDSS